MRRSFSLTRGTFTIRLWPTLITLVLTLTLLGLGSWQLQRLHWKEALLAMIAARQQEVPVNLRDLTGHEAELDYRPAVAAGYFDHDKVMYLAAVERQTGEGGYHVLTPLRLTNGQYLLVDRGWIPYARRPKDNAGVTDYAKPAGLVAVIGLLHEPAKANWLTPANRVATNDWYSIDLPAMASVAGVPGFWPIVLNADATPNPGGYPVGGQTVVTLTNNHLGYALTWFALALALLVIYGVSGWRKTELGSD